MSRTKAPVAPTLSVWLSLQLVALLSFRPGLRSQGSGGMPRDTRRDFKPNWLAIWILYLALPDSCRWAPKDCRNMLFNRYLYLDFCFYRVYIMYLHLGRYLPTFFKFYYLFIMYCTFVPIKLGSDLWRRAGFFSAGAPGEINFEK